jgi:3',5'-cyclic AMP phosphodiesterase CpdA
MFAGDGTDFSVTATCTPEGGDPFALVGVFRSKHEPMTADGFTYHSMDPTFLIPYDAPLLDRNGNVLGQFSDSAEQVKGWTLDVPGVATFEMILAEPDRNRLFYIISLGDGE